MGWAWSVGGGHPASPQEACGTWSPWSHPQLGPPRPRPPHVTLAALGPDLQRLRQMPRPPPAHLKMVPGAPSPGCPLHGVGWSPWLTHGKAASISPGVAVLTLSTPGSCWQAEPPVSRAGDPSWASDLGDCRSRCPGLVCTPGSASPRPVSERPQSPAWCRSRPPQPCPCESWRGLLPWWEGPRGSHAAVPWGHPDTWHGGATLQRCSAPQGPGSRKPPGVTAWGAGPQGGEEMDLPGAAAPAPQLQAEK